MTRLILASRSLGRAHLLREAGMAFEQLPTDLFETPRRGSESFEDYVQRLSREKAEHSAAQHPDAFILGADTLLEFENELIGKPADLNDAEQIVNRLAGRTHHVLSGFTLIAPNGTWRRTGVDTARVRFHPLTADEAKDYVTRTRPLAFAGGYALQGEGRKLVAGIEGHESTVVGLPIGQVLAGLREAGFEHA